MIRKSVLFASVLAASLVPFASWADPTGRLLTDRVNTYGVPSGLIDMPTAEMAPDAQVSITVSHFPGYTKNTATLQILPWITGSFRYSGIKDLTPVFDVYYDRSFDVRFQLLRESDYLPAVAVGLQDFLGTGIYSGEYVVATKEFGNRLRVTGGVGWGRLGSYNSFATIRSRAPFTFAAVGTGGNFNIQDWFAGDMALFGGLSYEITDKLSLAAEYSSDNYDFEIQQGVFKRSTPWNFALNYKPTKNIGLSLFSLHGEEFGLRATLSLNIKEPPVPASEPAPLPIGVRDPASLNDLGWTLDKNRQAFTQETLRQLLEQERITLEGVTIGARTAHVRVINGSYISEAQALGRTFRVLSRTMPGSIETFRVTLTKSGIPVMTTTFRRSDLERLEHGNESEALAAAGFSDSLSFGDLPDPLPGFYPSFNWSLSPKPRFYTFDPQKPFRADMRLVATADYNLGRGWVVSGESSVKLFGNLNRINRPPNSRLPHVRVNKQYYNTRYGPTIDRLTIAKYARLGKDLYGRFTAGYLEMMYAGASGEVLWKPVESRLALGAEVNFVNPREYDQMFGLRTRQTPGGIIPQWNGHLSAYYQFNNGFEAKVHAGRYLAGDWGATLEVARTFGNGWKIGAFATKTNVSAADFGEGSFDKGIFFTVPLAWAIGLPIKNSYSDTLRPLQRDGGQRVDVSGRLYDMVNQSHRPGVADTWGKFWR